MAKVTINSLPAANAVGTSVVPVCTADGSATNKVTLAAIAALAVGGAANIVSAATAASFPASGSSANLYVATDANRIYHWDTDNNVYVELGALAGNSGDGADAVLRALFAPPAPTQVNATIDGSNASVAWTAPTVLTQTPITDYTVQYSSDSGTTWTTFSRAASTATITSVTGAGGAGTTFRVAAINGAGLGTYSSSVTIAASKLSIARASGASTFTGIGTAASPFARTARVLNTNADGLMAANSVPPKGYTFTVLAAGTFYATGRYYDDIYDNNSGYIRKNGVQQVGTFDDSRPSGGEINRSFAVAVGDVVTFFGDNYNTSYENIRVWVV